MTGFIDRTLLALESPPYGHLRTGICSSQSGRLLLGLGLCGYSHYIALFHYQVVDTIDFDLGARPFAEQDTVANLNVDRDEFATLTADSTSNGGYLSLLRFLLGSVGNDYAAGGFASASIRSITTRS
jgi:hypothetical protein